MIVKSTFRRAKGLEVHLLRNDTNESVDVRRDLFRGAPLDLHLALRLMDGISRSNAHAVRSFVHVVIAPGKPLDDQAIATTLATIEEVFGIAADAPRAVVQHAKGARPSHFHAVYSIVDLRTGRAIKSHDNNGKDELISRRLELRFGEAIIPGPRLAENIAMLRARGATEEAEQLALLTAGPDQQALSRNDRQQAGRLGRDPAAMSAHVYDLYETAGRDFHAFARSLAVNGYHLCDGEKAVLVGEDESGFQTSLVRCLRREGKANGRPLQLREWHLQQAFPQLQPKAVERDTGHARARKGAARELDTEWQRGIFEAVADADAIALATFRAKRKAQREDLEKAEREAFRMSLKAQRDAIFELHRVRDEVRRLRVDRAFRNARLFGSPALHRLAFALAATGVLMTGAGVVAALLAGAFAGGALPSLHHARRLSIRVKRERTRDRHSRDTAVKALHKRHVIEGRRSSKQITRFSFDQVPKSDRILAGFYAAKLLGRSTTADKITVAAAEEALGPEIIQGIRTILERGSALQVRRFAHWYTGVPEGRRDRAVAAALARHQDQRVRKTQGGQKPAISDQTMDGTSVKSGDKKVRINRSRKQFVQRRGGRDLG